MDMAFTEKLIEEIKKRPVIYSENHPDHKFGKKRFKAWCEIGKELDEEVHILKSKWKNLKDSYKKCNQAKLGAGSYTSKKLSNWFWADYMRFIDASDDQAVLVDDDSNEPITSDMNNKGEKRVEKKQCRGDGETEAKKRKQDSADTEYKAEERKSRKQDNRYKETTEDVRKKRRTLDVTEESHLQNKKQSEVEEERVDVKCDAIDLLFLSYADTFKKLSRRTQISLKFELAKIFMEAELNDLNTLGLPGTELAEDSIASSYCDPLDAVGNMKLEMNP